MREAPSAHFRTSVHASPLFAVAVARLLRHVDDALGHPRELTMVDVGAGRGELLTGVLGALPADVAARVRPYAVERAPRPGGLDERIVWSRQLPAPRESVGLLFANEWLDNVPVEVAETDADGVPRTVLVRTSDGAERLGDSLHGPEAEWLERWWPLGPGGSGEPRGAGARGAESGAAGRDGSGHGRGRAEHDGTERDGAERDGAGRGVGREPDHEPHGGPAGGVESRPGRVGSGAGRTGGAEPGLRAEIGLPRDEAWAAAVGTLAQGLAVAVDFAHFREDRPPFGTLTAYLDGREVRPVPDGSRDLTAHVAMDACAAAGARAAADRGTGSASRAAATTGVAPPAVRSQRDALHSLGIDGARPPLALASSDPAAYVRQLASAGEAAELIGTGGLGSFSWLIQPVGGVPSPFG
ncbi:SAM-dependent methyltransferase [Streptomyces sp. WMMB 322]|uniref:SAM-dependent methyltransferase n=1 Tax=Streptomyces sp. WMMB 322 TaxID=1286821 RepID=UPI000ACCD6E9